MKITNHFILMHPDGTSEFFFIPEGDTRICRVSNTHSSQFSKDATEYNPSEYSFTRDSLSVKNNCAGIDTSDFITINKTN